MTPWKLSHNVFIQNDILEAVLDIHGIQRISGSRQEISNTMVMNDILDDVLDIYDI